jgi:hypothetical protein
MDPETAWIVKFEVQEFYYKKYEDWQQVVLLACCNPNLTVKEYLYTQNILHPREIFGTILTSRFFRKFKSLEMKLEPLKRRAKEVRRIGVGYRDKGSIQRNPVEKHDVSFNEEQEKIELKRKELQNTADFISGWIGL